MEPREIIEDLLKVLSLIETGTFDDSTTPIMERIFGGSVRQQQLVAWTKRVSSSLEAADLSEELSIWKETLESEVRISALDSSLDVQILSLRAVLLGILQGLEHKQQSDSSKVKKGLPREADRQIEQRRRYYSARAGKNLHTTLDLPMLCRMFCALYKTFQEKGYLQEAFGYYCVDAGDVPGTLGSDLDAQRLQKLRKTDLWPIEDKCLEYSEEDLFDLVEFVFDYVSKPTDGYYHGFNDCGWHYNTFDRDTGRGEFRTQMNHLLADYRDGYELSEEGEIVTMASEGLGYLLEANLPSYDPANVEMRVRAAIQKFRRYRSSLEDRRDAIRDLADTLEFLRPKLRQILPKKDERDLFDIANNFGIRHHNETQKTDYDKAIWFSWMFYYYLATIHAAVRLIKKYEESAA